MSRGAKAWLVAALLACLAPVAAHADDGPPVSVRVGTHPGYGRVVFDLPAQLDYRLTQQGEHVLVEFTGETTIGSATSMPHNVLGLTGGAGQAELVVARGAVARAWRLGNLVVVDVLDRPLAAGAPAVQAPAPAPASEAAGVATQGGPRPSSPHRREPPPFRHRPLVRHQPFR